MRSGHLSHLRCCTSSHRPATAHPAGQNIAFFKRIEKNGSAPSVRLGKRISSNTTEIYNCVYKLRKLYINYISILKILRDISVTMILYDVQIDISIKLMSFMLQINISIDHQTLQSRYLTKIKYWIDQVVCHLDTFSPQLYKCHFKSNFD